MIAGEAQAMNRMRGIYLRSLLLAFGFAALLTIELLAANERGAPVAAPPGAVGAPQRAA
jgi:hypothetical protein